MAEKQSQRVMLVVDGGSMLHFQKSEGWNMDFKFILNLPFDILPPKQEVDLFAAHYYALLREQQDEDVRNNFLLILKKLGYQVKEKLIPSPQEGKYTPRISFFVEVATDALINEDHYDIYFLLSDSGDYTYLCDTLKKRGKEIWVGCSPRQVNYELMNIADRFINLNDYRDILEKKRYSKPDPAPDPNLGSDSDSDLDSGSTPEEKPQE